MANPTPTLILEGFYKDPYKVGDQNFVMRWQNIGGNGLTGAVAGSGQSTGYASTLASAGAALCSAGGIVGVGGGSQVIKFWNTWPKNQNQFEMLLVVQ